MAEKDYGYVCSVTLTLEMILIQGHDIPLGHGHQVLGILSKSNMTLGSYVPDKVTTDDSLT